MVSEPRLRRWLRDVRQGRRTITAVVNELKRWPTDHLTFAQLDSHRRLRRGLPEVIFCEGKTPDQLIRIVRRFMAARDVVILSRLDPADAQAVQRVLRAVRYHPIARLGYWAPPRRRTAWRGLVVVASGGTSDLPVAEEALHTLELLGSRTARLYDVGVAGLHRVLNAFDLLQRARAVIVVAGMEGALPSVVAGLVRCPVIAVPTSIGYGASFAGIGPLLTMLNSCAPGIGVVNIDNGFGAGYLAHVINQATVRSGR